MTGSQDAMAASSRGAGNAGQVSARSGHVASYGTRGAVRPAAWGGPWGGAG